MITQVIANADPSGSAWVSANGAYIFNRLNDSTFTLATRSRLLIPNFRSGQVCICGHNIDILGAHLFVCQHSAVKGYRATMHANVSRSIKRIGAHYLKALDLIPRDYEPHCSNYFDVIPDPQSLITSESSPDSSPPA